MVIFDILLLIVIYSEWHILAHESSDVLAEIKLEDVCNYRVTLDITVDGVGQDDRCLSAAAAWSGTAYSSRHSWQWHTAGAKMACGVAQLPSVSQPRCNVLRRRAAHVGDSVS
jgi:hypothetical protein